MFLHLESLFHIKIHKNMWVHEGPHILEKITKRSGHMKAHNIILEFAPSGMWRLIFLGRI
jgi:hypothetical protein